MKRSSDSLITYRWLRSHSYSFIVVFIQGTCIRIKMTICVSANTDYGFYVACEALEWDQDQDCCLFIKVGGGHIPSLTDP